MRYLALTCDYDGTLAHHGRVDAPTLKALERLIDPVTRGDPESPLRWTCKSVRKLAEELRRLGHATSHRMVAELLHDLDYSLQAHRKTLEGPSHPDRDAQFAYINAKVQAALQAGEPVISVDAKKKELVGDFKNAGREWHPAGQAVPVRVYDFSIPALGRVTPYGGYDMARNAVWVNVGTRITTPPRSPWRVYAAGGMPWEKLLTRRPAPY